MKTRPSVLVIGAGISGLAAASRLHKKGFAVTVLEARERIGGRIHTALVGGFPADLGASAIHGVHGNPITRLARKYRFPLRKASYESVSAFDDSGRIPAKTIQALFTEQQKILDEKPKLRSKRDRPASILFKERDALHRWGQRSLEAIAGADLKQLSLKNWDDSNEYGGTDAYFPQGYGGIAAKLAEGLDIRFQEEVREVRIEGKKVFVRTRKKIYSADFAAVTVPLGVLKKGRIRFRPGLPARKKLAIERLGMGVLNKVVLVFSKCFPLPSKDFAGWTGSAQWPRFFNFFPTGRPMLVGFMGGSLARRMERESDAAVLRDVLNILRHMSAKPLPRLLDFHVTRWGSDPFSFGAYSYPAVNSLPEDHDALAEPLHGRIFFAGEATNGEHPSTVHGAYLSGVNLSETELMQ